MDLAAARDSLTCSVCQDIFKCPVTLPCGHNFCQDCIIKTWDNQEEREYFCPECIHRYRNRPELKRNTRLKDLVELYLAEANKSGILCTYCVDTPTPAVKSCQKCDSSFCDKHLKVHSKSPDHVLTEPTTDLQKRKCSVHNQTLEYYCVEDSSCICKFCMQQKKHRGHTIHTLSEASTKKKAEGRLLLAKLTNQREETEKTIRSLKKHKDKLQEKAVGIVDRVVSQFRASRRQIEDLERRVPAEITTKNEQMLSSVSNRVHQLEIKQEKLSKKIRHIEELHSITDPLTVIWESDRGGFCGDEVGENEHRAGDDEEHIRGADDLDEILISLNIRKELSDIVSNAMKHLSVAEDSDVCLDDSSAADNVEVSGDLKVAYGVKHNETYEQTSEKFESNQVLSSTSFDKGRHYWEVDIMGSNKFRIGMCYASIDRKGPSSVIGNTGDSWCLVHLDGKFSLRHLNNDIDLDHKSFINRLGIFLDYEAGRLSFYEVCDPVRHLHTFTTVFTEPLHAVFRVCLGVWARIRT